MSNYVDVASSRVLPLQPYDSIADYVVGRRRQGARGCSAVSSETIIEELAASGLRGRGGAGFPTGVKWRTIKSFASAVAAHVGGRQRRRRRARHVQGSGDHPRQPLRNHRGRTHRGAVPWTHDRSSSRRRSRSPQSSARLRAAIAEVRTAGWLGDVDVTVVEGPSEYLYGEETGSARSDRRPAAVSTDRTAVPSRDRRGRRIRRGCRIGQRVVRARSDGRDRARQPCAAGAGEQRRDDGQRARDHRQGRHLVPIARHRRIAGHDRVHDHRALCNTPVCSKYRWARHWRM